MSDNPWNVSESALRIIEQRSRGWPGDLFCQVLIDEVNGSRHLISSPPVGTRPKVELAGTEEWVNGRIKSLLRISTDYLTLLSSEFLGFFRPNEGPAGPEDRISIPADAPSESIPKIVGMSRRLAAVYRQGIEWSHSVGNADVHPVFREATYEFSFDADSILRSIEGLGPAMLTLMNRHRGSVDPGTVVQARERLEHCFSPKIPNLDRLQKALTSACARLQCGNARTDGLPAPGKSGYLYILTNPSLGNMVKIGRTTRNPRDRIDELSATTAIPTPFVLAFDAYVEDCERAEAYVHARLEKDGYRVAKNREFFNVDVATAIAVILEAQAAERKRNEGQREARRKREERQREVEAQRQREVEAQRQREVETQQQREAEAQRERALEAQRQGEAEAQRKRDLEAQRQRLASLIRGRVPCEAGAQRQRALEAKRQGEAEAQRQRELEAQRQRLASLISGRVPCEAEAQRQRDPDDEPQCEAEAGHQRKVDAQHQREAEAQHQREVEAQRQREAEARNQREAAARNQREAAARNQREAAARDQREAAARDQREAEAQRQREAEALRQREAESQRQREVEAQRQREAVARNQRELEAQQQREAEAQRQREAESQRQREERKREIQRRREERKRKALRWGEERSRAALVALVSMTRWLLRIGDGVLRGLARHRRDVRHRQDARVSRVLVSTRCWRRKADWSLRRWSSRLRTLDESGMRRCLWVVLATTFILVIVVRALVVNGAGEGGPESLQSPAAAPGSSHEKGLTAAQREQIRLRLQALFAALYSLPNPVPVDQFADVSQQRANLTAEISRLEPLLANPSRPTVPSEPNEAGGRRP